MIGVFLGGVGRKSAGAFLAETPVAYHAFFRYNMAEIMRLNPNIINRKDY